MAALAKLPVSFFVMHLKFNLSLIIGFYIFKNYLNKTNKKVLIRKRPFACSAIPSVNTSRGNAESWSRVQKDRRFFTALFSRIFGKSIDGRNSKCLLGNLSLKWERFFEIYFVRLIGTPNQHIPKRELRFVSCHLRMTGFIVVHESLGFVTLWFFSESLILAQNERWRRG